MSKKAAVRQMFRANQLLLQPRAAEVAQPDLSLGHPTRPTVGESRREPTRTRGAESHQRASCPARGPEASDISEAAND